MREIHIEGVQAPPVHFDVYHQSGGLALSGAMEVDMSGSTVVEFGGNTPQPAPPLMPPHRNVPVGERMMRQDPLAGHPIRHEPLFYERGQRRLR